MNPKGNIRKTRDQRDFVKGSTSPIPYSVRNPSGDWTNFFFPDSWIEQLYEGRYDSDSCWLFSSVDEWEEELEWLESNGQFSEEALAFLSKYKDASGRIKLSRDYLAVLSGVMNGGNSQIDAPKLLSQYGIIPFSMLSYSGTDGTYQQFINSYFSANRITQAMKDLGQQFLQYVSVAYEWIGDGDSTPPLVDIRANLLQSPLIAGIPIPADVELWNSPTVKYDGSTAVEHAVLLIAVNDDGSYKILDQYNPAIKTLSADYFIPLVSQTVLTPATTPNAVIDQTAPIPSLMAGIASYFRQLFFPTAPSTSP